MRNYLNADSIRAYVHVRTLYYMNIIIIIIMFASLFRLDVGKWVKLTHLIFVGQFGCA